MNKEETKKWEEFVAEELCPAKCGHLRFKVKRLIKEILQAHDKEIIEKIEGLENPYIEGEREYYGYEIAKKDVLIILTPNKQI